MYLEEKIHYFYQHQDQIPDGNNIIILDHGFMGFIPWVFDHMHFDVTSWWQEYVDEEAVYLLADRKQRE
jgi:hypothetical protein